MQWGAKSPTDARPARPSQAAGSLQLPDLPGVALESLLEAVPEAAGVADRLGRVLWANGAFSDLFQLPLRAIRGKRLALIAGAGAESDAGERLAALISGGDGQLELQALDRNGAAFPCLVRVRPLAAESEPLRLFTITDESSLQRLRADLATKAESALKAREILRATCEALEDGALVVDECERLVLANGAARRLFGLGGQETRGRSLTEIPLPAALHGAWLTFLASGRAAALQTVRVTMEGRPRTFLLRLARAASLQRAGAASMMIVRDLTQFTEPDRQKDDFIAQVSHELRTPLASIQGFVASLLEEPDLGQNLRREFLGIVQQESQRLSHLVEKLLDVVQFDAGRLILDRRVVDLGSLVREVVDSFADEAAAVGAPLTLTTVPQAPQAWIDPERIQTVVSQLVSNALQHGSTPRGVELSLCAAGDHLQLGVRDWGRGVPPEDVERIFDPFYRLPGDDQGQRATGAGLGLALCRQIIERHGGRVRAELPPEGGLKVSVEIPINC